jgi:hypothetical protein
MADIIFPEGISAFKPSERAPEFIKGNITVDAKKFQEWLQTHPELRDGEGRVRLVVKESAKEGNKWYLAVDTYKPEPKSDDAEIIVPF